MIVERPERILASVLGISAAYVRLGDRHCQGNNGPHPDRQPPQTIPFKIRKTSRAVDITSPVVTNVHGTKWMEELKELCTNAGSKLASTGKELVREPATEGEASKMAFHEGDLYLCPESLNAFQGALGGVLDAVDAVFQGTSTGSGPSRAFVCIRPPGHHCSDDHPSGFCWVNNVHVGIEHAIMQYGLTHAAIIDFDLHHGDGSQAIAWARNKKVQNLPKGTANRKKTSIGYFSLHDINSFPCEWGEDDKVQAASLCIENAHGQTVWNIHLQPWTTPEEFWRLYETRYLELLDKVRNYLKLHTKRLRSSPNQPVPKAVIFLSAGFDASEWETPGMQRHGTNVPTEFYARFTRDVVRLAEEEGTGVEGRVISVLEGGYSDRALTSGVLSHLSGLTDGQIKVSQPVPTDAEVDLSQRLQGMGLQQNTSLNHTSGAPLTLSYNAEWWHANQLTALENLVNPPPPPKVKKYKTGPLPTYCSPTQSFTAKLADPERYKRTVSGTYVEALPPREPTPPPPDVDWVTATHSLSKLLVPFDRQTESCKPAELAEPKVKKDKLPPAPLTSVHVDPSGRQLRGRKQVASYREAASDEESIPARPESKNDRRRTMAVLPTTEDVPKPPTARRLSMASSIGSTNGDGATNGAPSVSRRRSVTPAATDPKKAEVTVKKARGASSRVPKNPPPVPRVPFGFTNRSGVVAEKENENDVDSLTSGLKRITLKLPPKEEYEAREKQKALDAEKKATTTPPAKGATRRVPAVRAKSTTKFPATTARKTSGQSARALNQPSPAEAPLAKPEPPVAATLPENSAVSPPTQSPEPPMLSSAVTPPLGQPSEPSTHLHPPEPEKAPKLAPPKLAGSDRSVSTDTLDPPTELREMVISPEQLPRPSFIQMTSDELLSATVSPPRPDSPPAPAPSMVPEFANFAPSRTFDLEREVLVVPSATMVDTQPQTQGLPEQSSKEHTETKSEAILPKRAQLPVFSSYGAIPFASSHKDESKPASTTTAEIKSTEVDIWAVPDTHVRQ